jgi:hypothetical protein
MLASAAGRVVADGMARRFLLHDVTRLAFVSI